MHLKFRTKFYTPQSKTIFFSQKVKFFFKGKKNLKPKK